MNINSPLTVFTVFLLFIYKNSFAHQTITDNQNWCDGEVKYLNDIIHEFNHHELLIMGEYAARESNASQEPNHSGQPPSHYPDDDWNYLRTVVTGFCKEQSILYSENPSLAVPIILGPDTFFDIDITEQGNNDSDETTLTDHHETYQLTHGIKVVCAVCRGQLTQVSENSTPDS